jgi:UDP-glucose 4-epimerase
MRVLISGGLGFIGCNLALKCLSLGWEVVIVDEGRTEQHIFRREVIAKAGSFKLYNQNLKSFVITSKFSDFDVVFHLAALPSVSYSVERPYASFRNNVQETTLIMLSEISKNSNIGRVVFASSAAVYGNTNVFPTTEGSEKKPESPYGLQKLLCEQLIEFSSRTQGFDAVSLRYFNVYGPYQYLTGAYATAVSAWLNAIKNNMPLRKDGTGEQSRDMVYVEDIVQANILAATYEGDLKGIPINIASGTEISNNEILEMISSRFNVDIEQAPFRPGDVMRTCPSIQLARKVLGYEPKFTFEEGLQSTIESLGI